MYPVGRGPLWPRVWFSRHALCAFWGPKFSTFDVLHISRHELERTFMKNFEHNSWNFSGFPVCLAGHTYDIVLSILSFSDVQQKRYKELLQHHNQHLREKTPLHRLMDVSASPFEAPGFLGMFGRFAVIGDRLSPFVSGACMIMACLGWRHRVEGWHALGFVRSWRPILYKLWMFVIEF